MNRADVARCELVMFAAEQVGRKGSLEQMKAICYCIRNRVRAGWNEGNWLEVIQDADASAAHELGKVRVNTTRRDFERMLREVDDIYYGQAHQDVGSENASLEDSLKTAKYWCFVNIPRTPWFQVNIEQDRKNHPNLAQMGLMMFFE